jgi:hypothetical protein
MRPFRHVALVLVVAVLVTSCGSARDLVDDVPGVTIQPSDQVDGATDPTSTGDPTSPEPDSGSPDTATDPDVAPTRPPGSTATDQVPQATPVSDGGAVGANGPAMLRGDRARLVIEVDVQEGVAMDQAAVDHLVDELRRHVDKPGGITFAGGNTFASDRTEWSVGDLREAAAANRTTSSTADSVSVHVLYVRGGFHQDGEETAAIGVAYTASSVAVFPERWAGLGALLGSSRAIERAVLVHEFGHLFGLVNLTYESEIDHEDPQHPGHSSSQQSVMFHAIESTLIGQVFSGPPPDRFDDADAADLAGLRSGRY